MRGPRHLVFVVLIGKSACNDMSESHMEANRHRWLRFGTTYNFKPILLRRKEKHRREIDGKKTSGKYGKGGKGMPPPQPIHGNYYTPMPVLFPHPSIAPTSRPVEPPPFLTPWAPTVSAAVDSPVSRMQSSLRRLSQPQLEPSVPVRHLHRSRPLLLDISKKPVSSVSQVSLAPVLGLADADWQQVSSSILGESSGDRSGDTSAMNGAGTLSQWRLPQMALGTVEKMDWFKSYNPQFRWDTACIYPCGHHRRSLWLKHGNK